MKFVVQTFKAEKRLILISFLIFVLSTILGVVAGLYFGEEIQKFINQYIRKMFKNILENANNPYLLFLAILKNNMRVYLILITAGTLTFGLISLFVLLSNGFIVGAVATISAKQTSLAKTLLLILPHGIFEIAAFLIGSAASAIFLESAVFSKEKLKLNVTFKRFLTLVVCGAILVVFAAFIEAFVTIKFAK
ncbi:stage II sporulation protein M [Anaerocellum danielii]|uniref:Stage II sporulation protein M n=1 Tax=Anaerocellum danielii TaxID=1387557 RepID=A0ABZ0TZJ2_9FIRM|nr:stage II sporulation protein M [Caldicellulosiruptor danielii]WPX08892.1 stage II sporulation protein M [Caldicellulosiruptor danielii]